MVSKLLNVVYSNIFVCRKPVLVLHLLTKTTGWMFFWRFTDRRTFYPCPTDCKLRYFVQDSQMKTALGKFLLFLRGFPQFPSLPHSMPLTFPHCGRWLVFTEAAQSGLSQQLLSAFMLTAAGTLWSLLGLQHMENVWEHEVIVVTDVTSLDFYTCEKQSNKSLSRSIILNEIKLFQDNILINL